MIRKASTDTGLMEAPSFTPEPGTLVEGEPPAPAPRKRGRPRKNPLPEEPTVSRGDTLRRRRVLTDSRSSASSDSNSESTAADTSNTAATTSTTGAAASDSAVTGSTPIEGDAAASSSATRSARSARSARSTATRSTAGAASDGSAAPASAISRPAASTRSAAGTRTATRSAASATGRSGSSSNGNGSNGGSNGGSNNGSSNNFNGSSGGSNSNASSNNNGSGGKGKGGYQSYGRRPRRNYSNNSREQIVPQASREELEVLKVAELREKAAELELDISAIKKKEELIESVLDAMVKAEGFVACEGILDLLPEGYGFLRTSGYLPGESDVYVGMSMVRRNGLRKGDFVVGQVRPARDNEKYAALHRIDVVNGLALDEVRARCRFADLTPVYPDERLLMEHGLYTITARTIDLVAPIGKGQRGLIVSPPKAGKTTILKDIAAAISANNPDVHLMCLLVDERPEEVTDMQRSIKGEVVSSTFDMPSENHIAVAELVIERAKRLVEVGRDVVILLDSITRLARAYNLAQPASGRILSGGVDSTALYPPKRFLGAARNIEGGGSLTILASALIETGSKMDEVIFEEFKGTGNMELRLDRDLADRRIFPAIDPVASGTRKEDLLLDAQEAPLIWAVRRILANMNNTERAMEMLIKSLKQTQNNAEFLMRTAKKAQQKSTVEIAEL
jgi:transcription termination factor Rho